MRIYHKILVTSFLAALATTPSFVLLAQVKKQKAHSKQHTTVEVKAGYQFPAWGKVNNNNTATQVSSFAVNTPLCHNIHVEGGVNFNNFIGTVGSNFPQRSISIPLSLQYYPMPKIKKVEPYCGVGIQCTFEKGSPAATPGNRDILAHTSSPTETKYISIFFTHGLIYEINTHVQVSGSVHFITGSEKRIGVDLGFGYKLP